MLDDGEAFSISTETMKNMVTSYIHFSWSCQTATGFFLTREMDRKKERKVIRYFNVFSDAF